MRTAAAIPDDSEVRSTLDTAYFHDSFEAAYEAQGKSALDIYLEAVACTPAWMDFLMVLRNRIVSLFGLKNLGRFTDIGEPRDPSGYKPGDRVGIFSIAFLSDREVVLRDTDKHLDAQISVFKYPDADRKIAVSTVVHVNNLLGRVYLFFVVPVHKIIVPSVLKRLSKCQQRP